jgi:hypothetical protein
MLNLPDPRTVAALVSNVTETMCGISFGVAETNQAALTCWRMAVLNGTGGSPWQVALFSDRNGCAALGAAMFQRPPESLDSAMLEDALCKLLNMAAGQIKGLLSADSALGLPKITSLEGLTLKSRAAMRDGVLLRSQDSVSLMIVISEGPE